MKVEKHGIDEGGVQISNYVPMGMFTICTRDHVRRYLKSSGFGPCIGLAMHSEEFNAGVLAHFMSKNGVQLTMERISQELRLRNISSKQRNWKGVVFLGTQGNLGQKTALIKEPPKSTPKSKMSSLDFPPPKSPAKSGASSFLDLPTPKSTGKSGASSFLDLPIPKSKPSKSSPLDLDSPKKTMASESGGGLDLNISSESMTNAKERAEEILRILKPMAPEFVDDGFGSCVFEVDTGRVILSEAKIQGYNNPTALFADEGQALTLALSQMG